MRIFNRRFRVVSLNKGPSLITYSVESQLTIFGVPLWWSRQWVSRYSAGGAIIGMYSFDDPDEAFECAREHKEKYEYHKLPVKKKVIGVAKGG